MQGGRTDRVSLPHCSDEPVFSIMCFPTEAQHLGRNRCDTYLVVELAAVWAAVSVCVSVAE